MQKGAIEITGYISPTSETDTYPTHVDIYGKGGYRSVLTLTDLDDIPLERRSEGMLAYVVDINKLYKLNSNNTWEEFISLPPLGTFTVAGITYPKIYVGTESGVPEASESFGYALIDILALNARFLTGNFIMADALFQPSYPYAQFISNLPDGVLAKTGKTLRGAEGGVDFVDIVDRNLVVEGCIPAWLVTNNKTLRNTRLKIIEGSAQDGDDLQGIRTLIANAMISRNAITSNDSVFGLNNVGTRELKIYDRTDVGAGRLTRSVNFIAAYQLANSVNFYLPETPSSLGKVLADVGETIYDGRVFRKLDFVDIASNSAKYILQVPNQSLPNAQALDVLGLGILKVTAGGVLTLATGGIDYVTPVALEEETAARVEADSVLEASVTAVQAELQAQIAAITGYGSLALLTEFLVNLGWTTGYSEYLWSKYRPLRTYNTYGDTDNYSKDGGNIWYDANHLGAAGSFKPGLRITSWDSSTIFANDLFPVSIGLFGYKNQLGYVSAQEGFVWQSYMENDSSNSHYRFPKNFGMYYVGHDEGQIGWNRKEILLMNYDYGSSSFSFEKKAIFKTDVIINYLASGILKVTNGLVGLAIPDTDYATSALLEQIKTETEGFRNEAETFASQANQSSIQALNSRNEAQNFATQASESSIDALNSRNEANTFANQANQSSMEALGFRNETEVFKNQTVSAKDQTIVAKDQAVMAKNEAVTAQNEAQMSAINADQNADAAYMTYQQVLDLFNNFINTQMTTSYANIEISQPLDPNSQAPKFQNFKTYYPPESTNINPIIGTVYSVIDSAFPYTDNFSRKWSLLAEMGSETAVNSILNFTFYHKLLSEALTPFKINITPTSCDIYFDGFIHLNNKNIKQLADPVDLQDATSKSWVINYINSIGFNIELQGDVTGSLSNGIIQTTLGPINISKITNFANEVQNIAKGISLDQFALPTVSLDLNSQKIINLTTDGFDSQASTCKWVKDTIKSIQLNGAVVGTISNEFIAFTKIGSDPIISNNVLNLSFEEDALDPRYYEVCYNLPSSEDYMLPTFNFKMRAGTTASTNRGWGMKMKPGSYDVINGDFSIYMHHFLLPEDNTITPFKITYSIADGKPRIYMKSILDMYNYPIVGVPDPLVGDGVANKTYVDGKNWLSSSITDFVDSAINAAKSIRLDQFAIPTLDINLGGVKFTNASDPINGQDFVTKNFLLNTLADGVPTTITGAVYGSGVGTVNTSFNPDQDVSNMYNATRWTYTYQNVTESIPTLYNTISILDSVVGSTLFQNRVARGTITPNMIVDNYYLDKYSSNSNYMAWNKTFISGGIGGQQYTVMSLSKPNNSVATFTLDAYTNFSSAQLRNIGDGTLSTDAITKNQLDNKPINTLPVTGDVDLGTYRVLSSATPTSGNHLINKTYVDSLIGASGGASGGVWQTYTPSIIATITNPTPPTGFYMRGSYRITGKSCIISFIYTNNGSTANLNNGSGIYLITLPPNVVIDESKLYVPTPASPPNPGYYDVLKASVLGYAIVSNGPFQIENNIQIYASPFTTKGLMMFRMSTNNWGPISSGAYQFNASAWISYQFIAEVPIL